MEVNRNTAIIIIVIVTAILGGIGFMWMNNKPQGSSEFKPIMPPGGYSGSGGYPSQSGGSSGYPGQSAGSGSYPGQSGQGGQSGGSSGR